MDPNLTCTVTTNAAEAASTGHYDQNLAAIIAAIALLITLGTVLYKFGQQVGEIKGIKQVVDDNFKSLNQKFDISEKIQKVELGVEKLSIESNANKENIKESEYNIVTLLSDKSSTLETRCERLESRIESLENELETHKKVHPTTHKSSAD